MKIIINKYLKKLMICAIIFILILSHLTPLFCKEDKYANQFQERVTQLVVKIRTYDKVAKLKSTDYVLERETYNVVNRKDAKGEIFEITPSFRFMAIMIAGYDKVGLYQFAGGYNQIDQTDDNLKGFIDETIEFYNNFGTEYADYKDEKHPNFTEYLNSGPKDSRSLKNLYENVMKYDERSKDKFAIALENYLYELESPIIKYYKEIDGVSKNKNKDKDNEENKEDKLIYTKNYLNGSSDVSDNKDIEKFTNESINELIFGDERIGMYENENSFSWSDFFNNPINYTFRYAGRMAIIFVASTSVGFVDGVYSLMQNMFFPGLPSAIKNRIYSDQIKEYANNCVEYGYYYSFYNAGKRGNDIDGQRLNKTLPVYINFHMRDKIKSEEGISGINDDIEYAHPEWFGKYSQFSLPLVYIGPNSLLTNKIPLFDINFFKNSSQTQKSFITELSEEEFVDLYIKFEATNKDIDSKGQVLQESYDRLEKKALEIYRSSEVTGSKVDGSSNSTAEFLRLQVSKWYYAIRNMCILFLAITLTYTGIRIVISNTGDKKAKYKQMLIDWISAAFIVLCIHIIMIILVEANNLLINMISPSNAKFFNQYGGDRAINSVRYMINICMFQANLHDIWGYIILYIFIAFYTVKLIVIFIKRVFYMILLTVLAPLVGLSYSIDKIADGKSQAFDYWFKEYSFNLLLMPIYLLMFNIFTSIADTAILTMNNWVLGIILVVIIISSTDKVIDIIKFLFGIKSKTDDGRSKLLKFFFQTTLAGAVTGIAGLARNFARPRKEKNKKSITQKLKDFTFNRYDDGLTRRQRLINNGKRKIAGFRNKSRNLIPITKRKLKNTYIRTGKNLKLTGKKVVANLKQNGVRYVTSGAGIATGLASGTAMAAMMFGNGIVSGDIENSLMGAISGFSDGYGLGSSSLKKAYNSIEAEKDYQNSPYLAYYRHQIGATSAEPKKDKLEEFYKEYDEQVEQRNQYKNNQFGSATEWFNNQYVQSELKRSLPEKVIEKRSEDIKLLHLAGVQNNKIKDGLKFLQDHEDIPREVGATMYKNLESKTSEEINKMVKNESFIKDISKQAMVLKSQKENEEFYDEYSKEQTIASDNINHTSSKEKQTQSQKIDDMIIDRKNRVHKELESLDKKYNNANAKIIEKIDDINVKTQKGKQAAENFNTSHRNNEHKAKRSQEENDKKLSEQNRIENSNTKTKLEKASQKALRDEQYKESKKQDHKEINKFNSNDQNS